MSDTLQSAREALARWTKEDAKIGMLPMPTTEFLRAALAEVDRLAADIAELERLQASIHKAVAAERAAVVAHLRTGGRTANEYADAVEAGEHHAVES